MPPKAPKKKLPSPKHVRRGCLARSVKKTPGILPDCTIDKYYSVSPTTRSAFVKAAKESVKFLEEEQEEEKAQAQRELFKGKGGAGPSTSSDEAGKRKKNKPPDSPGSPDCGLPASHPGRDGKRKSRRIIVD